MINIREKGEVFGYRKSEIINQELEREKKLRSDSYEKNKQTEEILNKELENLNEKLEKAIKNNDKKRRRIGEKGRIKYNTHFNSTKVAKFIFEKTLNLKLSEKYFWDK